MKERLLKEQVLEEGEACRHDLLNLGPNVLGQTAWMDEHCPSKKRRFGQIFLFGEPGRIIGHKGAICALRIAPRATSKICRI